MEAEEQHWQACQDYTSSTATYSTETQERKQYMTFKEAQQHIQEQKQRTTFSIEADTQEWRKAWKRTLKTSGKHGSGHSKAADNSGVYTTSLKMQ
jgi:hypothetical protein